MGFDFKRGLGWVLIIGILIFIIPVILYSFVFAKTGKNTSVLGRDYSLLTKPQILSQLQTDFILPPTLTLRDGDRLLTLDTASISAQINSQQIVSNLLFRRLNQGLIKYFQEFFLPQDFKLELTYNNSQFDQYLQDLSSDINQPFVPTELELNQGKIIVKNGQIGRQLSAESLKSAINHQLTNYQFAPLDIPTDPVGNLPSPDALNQSLSLAQNIIGKSVVIVTPDHQLPLPDTLLISWIGFDHNCLTDKITNYFDGIKDSLQKNATDAVFKFENNQVTEFVSSSDGYRINIEPLQSQVCQKVTELSQSTNQTIQITAPFENIKPNIVNSDVNNLGIKELLGKGDSSFSHSTAIRNYNVAKGASIINRLLVAPNDTFSFIKNLGEVTLASGYKQAYIIRQGRTELDVGGGICQVSTTLFRAILNAGLNVTARQNHAYRVSYYEEDSKPGFDATVFIPNPDLKFVNDTGHHLLIQSYYDGKNKKLTYEIYGTSDGRQTEITNYRQWGAAPAPPAVHIDDPTLPVGKTIQDEHSIPGLKTSFDWKVTRNGEVIHQKTFTSSYAPWAAVYRHGVAP